MLVLQDVKKSFGPFDAVKGISFSVDKGEVIGLLGPNGAGKTTTMRMMTGFYLATSGSIQFGGLSVAENRHEIQKRIGYLPESASSYSDMLVSEFLTFAAKARGLSNEAVASGIDYAVTSTSLQDYFYRPISHLSKGYRQRVGLASSLLHDPELLILDEPTSGLDPNQIIEIQRLIQTLSQTKTIILSTHILKEVEATCQRCIIVNNGKLILDKPLSDLQKGSKGTVKVKVSIRGNQLKAVDVLKKVFEDSDDVIQSLGGTKDTNIAVTSSRADVAGLIFKAAVDNNWVLSELVPEKENLEDVFSKLTLSSSEA